MIYTDKYVANTQHTWAELTITWTLAQFQWGAQPVTYTDKLSTRNTVYSNKLSTRNTVYSNKFTPRP